MHETEADVRGVVAQRRGFVPCAGIYVSEAVTYAGGGGMNAGAEGGGGVAEGEKVALNAVFAVVSVGFGSSVGPSVEPFAEPFAGPFAQPFEEASLAAFGWGVLGQIQQ